MQPAVEEWAHRVLRPEEITGKRILETGSYNENGSLRDWVQSHDPALYLGIDMRPGPGVDLVLEAEEAVKVFRPGFHIVLSTEMLEHALKWQAALTSMKRCLVPKGLLVLTTCSPGFGYHPYPEDYWRFTPQLMQKALGDMVVENLEENPDQPGVFVRARKYKTVKDISRLRAIPVR